MERVIDGTFTGIKYKLFFIKPTILSYKLIKAFKYILFFTSQCVYI